ncbi:hypothetical protein PspS34_11265 [Pseudomonas sp. S34]|nr:hypothetical protein PspS34_11265 [Pseudomonas sp. S34]
MLVGSGIFAGLIHRIREQARSHNGSPVNTNPVYDTDQSVGAGLLAKRPSQPTSVMADTLLSRATRIRLKTDRDDPAPDSPPTPPA